MQFTGAERANGRIRSTDDMVVELVNRVASEGGDLNSILLNGLQCASQQVPRYFAEQIHETQRALLAGFNNEYRTTFTHQTRFGPLVFFRDRKMAISPYFPGISIDLTPSEAAVLGDLIQQPLEVRTPQQLAKANYGHLYEDESREWAKTPIFLLRRKLRGEGDEELIHTILNSGYSLTSNRQIAWLHGLEGGVRTSDVQSLAKSTDLPGEHYSYATPDGIWLDHYPERAVALSTLKPTESIELTDIENLILRLLMKNPTEVFTATRIVDLIIEQEPRLDNLGEVTIKSHLSRLRQKLGLGSTNILKSLGRGRGLKGRYSLTHNERIKWIHG